MALLLLNVIKTTKRKSKRQEVNTCMALNTLFCIAEIEDCNAYLWLFVDAGGYG